MVGVMVRDGEISDELWEILATVMPQDAGRRGRPWNDHRLMLEGIIWRFRTGSPWRDLPACFGPFQSVWQRHRLWSVDGTYERMLAAVGAHTGLDAEQVAQVLSIDATSVRAHQHAAGARRDSVAEEGGSHTGGRFEPQEFSPRARGAA